VTVARVDATSAWRRLSSHDGPGPPAGPGWFVLGERLADAAATDAWVAEELAGTAGGHRDLAGALVVYRFAGSLAELVVGPLLGQRRALVLSAATVALRLGPQARLEEVSVARPPVAVLPDDPAAPGAAASAPGDAGDPPGGDGDGVVVVDGEAGLRAAAVASLLATFGPLAEAVRARAPFGLRGMWGTLADHLAEVALRRAREGRRDPEAAWAAVDALLDDLAGHQPLLVARPRPHRVGPPGAAPALFATKGTCCLVYKAAGPAGTPAQRRRLVAEAACTSCPLRPEDDRAARLLAYLRGAAG
jgi:hypothetical protein